MRLIDADALIEGRVENDPVKIAVQCAPTAYNLDAVVEQLREKEDIHNRQYQFLSAHIVEQCIDIVRNGGKE